ncbi:TatD family hydrolase [Saccharicrinis sp. FJH2]|uniref:TatD family hydrolase n=1 Tax=Saccharicrinis sp. FJH65 TaxID=3344659 RepID=UPI0035F3640C
MIDTHSHIYLSEFDTDRTEVISRSKNVGVDKIILPNIDLESYPQLISTYKLAPDYFTILNGLHPTSVNTGFRAELNSLLEMINDHEFKGIGEIGIDLYWDKTYINEQKEAFRIQIDFAIQHNLPFVIHARDSFSEIFTVLKEFSPGKLNGVFHSFTGGLEEIQKINKLGNFYFGINGVVTFKNSNLRNVLKDIGLNRLLLETDSPYLTPVPYRGKRNESSYLYYICRHISEHTGDDFQKVDEITTRNAIDLFNLL